MREVYNENKPIVLAENSKETDLSFKSAVMKKENPSITMYLGVDWILCDHSMHCVTL